MGLKRRDLLGVIAAGSALGLAPAVRAAGPDRSRQRNVILLVSDDQGLDLGSLGVAVKTPNIDALAAQGTRFDQAIAMRILARAHLALGQRDTGVAGFERAANLFKLIGNTEMAAVLTHELANIKA